MVSAILLVVLVALPGCHSKIPRDLPSHVSPASGRSNCSEAEGRRCVRKTESCEVLLDQYSGNGKSDNCICCAVCDSPNECTGTLREACNVDEFLVSDHGTFCKCCQSCVAVDCNGRCVSDSSLCNVNEYVDGTCTGSSCACCVACGSPDDQCAGAGGICVAAGNDCPCGTWINPDFGCSGDQNCKCCVACTPSSACTGGHNPGRCVTNSSFCSGKNEYILNDGCYSNSTFECSCCKTCTPDRLCANENGVCYNKIKHTQCPSGFRKSLFGGACCSDECICCIRDECSGTSTDCKGYGAVCFPQDRNCMYYETNDYCPDNEKCCKYCYPDETCSSEGGICIHQSDGGCTGGFIKSLTGSCCNHPDECTCCVPDTSNACLYDNCFANGTPAYPGNALTFDYYGSYYIYNSCGASCTKFCKPDAQCCNEGGVCYSYGCPPGYEVSNTGNCTDDPKCYCCVYSQR